MRPRVWPRRLTGQMLLAVALALLLVQAVGALLLYRAQAERQHADLVHAAAFRLIAAARGGADRSRPSDVERGAPRFPDAPFARRPFRTELEPASPLAPGEPRDLPAASELRDILAEQGVAVGEVVVARRPLADDVFALARARQRAARLGHPPRESREMLVAGARLPGGEWLVTRFPVWRGGGPLVMPLLFQTLLIYVVVVGAIALILRRITRPLAALTRRVESFTQTRSPAGQLAPEGPDDVARLIGAHNAMEARIAALLDEKDVMLGAIGHDLKTPLAALRVRIESVDDEAERARMAATIEDIARTLDDILSLARVGRPSDPRERAELSALVAAVVEEFEDMGSPVTLGDTTRIALPLRPTWLRRALRNLIGNAVRYGRAARVSLAREGGLAGDWAVIRIDDDGPGIPEGATAAMMDPFTRGEPSRNTETGGAGLGLALARAIAEQHGGALTLANRRDAEGAVAGLTAELRLPLT